MFDIYSEPKAYNLINKIDRKSEECDVDILFFTSEDMEFRNYPGKWFVAIVPKGVQSISKDQYYYLEESELTPSLRAFAPVIDKINLLNHINNYLGNIKNYRKECKRIGYNEKMLTVGERQAISFKERQAEMAEEQRIKDLNAKNKNSDDDDYDYEEERE